MSKSVEEGERIDYVNRYYRMGSKKSVWVLLLGQSQLWVSIPLSDNQYPIR